MGKSGGKADQQAARSARLSAALRENLKRRKAQARGRADGGTPEDDRPAGEPQHQADTPDFRRNRGRE
jgi:hypothetical protein